MAECYLPLQGSPDNMTPDDMTIALHHHSSDLLSSNHTDVKPSVCSPVKRFGFLKTHKTGSTTIFNVLLRYSVKQGLNVVLPEKGMKYKGGDAGCRTSCIPTRYP